MMKTLSLLSMTALLAVILTACGQKGALYLPQKAPTNPTASHDVNDNTPQVSDDPNDF